jgi:DNA polymerase III epsilon subunit-like protein
VDFEYLKPIIADGSGDGDGEYTDAERRADVATQFRDKFGRWIEMGRGIKGKIRLGKRRGTDAGRTARIVGKFINATPDGKFARILVDPSDPNFAGKVVYIRSNNAEEILATLDPEYLKKRGIQLGKNTEGFEVGDEGIQDEDTLRVEDPTPQDLKDAEADLPDPGDYKQEASTLIQSAVAGKDLAAGNIVYDQGSDQYGKITQVRTLADGTKQIFVQFQNGRRAILNVPADHPIQAWIGKDEAKPTPEVAPAQNREGSSIADLGIDLQTATMDANGARLPTPGAFTGVLQKILAGAKNWKQVAERLKSQVITYFDFETTGISDYDGQGIRNDPIQLGAVQVKNGKVVKRFNVYINPGSKLSEWSANNLKRDVVDGDGNIVRDENGKPVTTAVTPEWLQEQMSPEEALKQFLAFIGPNAILGGQNIPFDLEILQRMADDAGIKLNIAGTVDSKDLASLLPKYDPEKGIDGPKAPDRKTGEVRASSSLGPVANFLGFEPANWHSADGDAEDSFNLVSKIIDRAAAEDSQDMRLLNFPEMQKLYQERMAAFKNSISGNNPVTEAQLNALNELAGSENQEIAAEAKKAINEATTRGKAAEVLARLNTDKDRTNNTPNQFRIGGGGGGELGEGNGIPNKKELAFLNRLGYFLKKKFTKKPKQYIPVGYDRIDSWERYPSWYKDMYESAGNLDDFVKLFWKALRESRKGTRLEDPEGRTDINEKEYAIAAATYKNLQGIGEKVTLRYGEFTIEFDKQSDINGQLLDELKDYLRTARQLGLKLPVRIKIAKQGDPAFTEGEVIGFDKDHPELGFLTGEAHTEDDGTMHLILWDQLHNMDKADLRRLVIGIDENGEEDYLYQNPGGFVSALQHVFFHELGHLWNREKHGRMVNSPLWGEFKKIFWGTDAKPFKRFAVTPNADLDPKRNPQAFDERMAELFAAAIIAFHNKEDRVLPNIGQFWKVAIEPYIDAEPLHWTANSERINPPKKEEKGKGKKTTTTPRGGKARTPDVKKPEDVKPGDIVYDKDGNLHGKVVVIRQDRHGNWHYWVEGKDYKPGDVFPKGLDEYIVHKNGIIYVTKAGANFVPDDGPDFIYPLPEKLDSSNADAVKAEDLKPGMVYESPNGPANVVNVFEHGIGVPDVKKSSDRTVVYVGKDGEVKHEVVPVGTFKKVLTSSKSNVPAPAPAPENENQGGEGSGNGNDRGGEGNGGGGGGGGGNASEPASEEPESRSGASKSDLENLKAVLEQAIGIGKRFGPDENLDQRARMISDEADEIVQEIIKLDIKDYPGLIKHLKENLPVISEGMYSDKTKQVLDEVKEFLDPGYRNRQYDAFDRIKELLKERIEAVDVLGEKTDLGGGIIDDILRPYLDDKAGLNYEELLDLLDKNLKPGEIKHVQKREGISFRGNWEEVVKAVQDIINANVGKKESVTESKTETTSEPEITTDDPIGRGKIDPKGYGTNEGYVRMTHPKPDFPAETDNKKLIEKGFEIEEQDNRDKPSQNREEDGEEGEEGVLPYEDPSKFAVGKKTTIIWHNKDFSSPGARIKITYTRKADGSLDESYTEIQWIHWDGSISGDGYGPGKVEDFELERSEQETFRRAFEFATKALARRNEEYNNNELPGQFPHPFRKVGENHIWRVVKDAKTGKLKAGRDTKRDMENKPPFGAVISHKDGKWTANILDPKGNVVSTFEVDGDENDKSALENIMNQSYAELAKKYRGINAPRPTPAARPAGKATDEHNFPLPDDVEMFKIRNGRLTEYGINLKADVDIFGRTSASIRDGLRFGAVIGYIESKGHWYVGLRDANSYLDLERGIKDLSVPETYKTIKGDINDPKAWEEAVKEARKFVSDAIARHGGKNIRYEYEHRPIESLDDVRVNDYLIFRTGYPPSINYADTDHPEEYISNIIGKVLSIGKDKDGNRTFKIQTKDGKIKNLTDKKLDYVGGAVRFSDDDPNITVSTTEIVKKRLAKHQMRELRFSIGMDIEEDPNNSEDSLERIYKAVEDKIGPDLIENHKFIQSLSKAFSKKMYDKSNTKGYLTEEEIYEIVYEAVKNYSTEKKPATTPIQPVEEEEATPTTSPTGLKGGHNHPLPEDVQMFPAGVGELYAKYVINGEGFQHEADYPDVRAKDGLRYGAEIYYEEAIEPNSYNKKGSLAGWRISLLNNAWREDMSRRRLIDYRIAEIPGDINDPEAWKKAVEEARKMLANAIAENGGNNNPYTSEYIPLESLDQLQAGDYLMNDAFFPPTIRYEGTKSEEVSPQFYAKIAAVGKDKDGNRIFEVERTAVKDSKPYTTVFTDEEFIKQFGIDGGIARYSDENPNVKPAAEPVAETKVEEEPKELTEEELQANRDAWSKVGQLYREYIAAKRGTNKKREAKRLKQELSPYPAVMLHEKLTDYRDILDNTRSASTDENEKKALTKRSAEITDAMKQLNILVNKGVKEGAGKPTDPLEFNFDNLFRDIELEDGISESDVEEAVNEPEVVEEPAVVEEPVNNVIETAGGVLDFDGLSPMQLGKINKHLDSKVVWEGEVMTYRELYKKFAIGKRKFQVRKDTDYVDGKPAYSWGPIEYRLFIDENRGMVKVPKMIYDAFKPTSSDPSLNEDRTSEVIEAEWAKEEAKKAATTPTTAPAVSTTPAKPTTPPGFGPQKLTSETAKKYPAMNIDKDWTIYGPDGYALGVVTKKETVGSVTKLTVKGLDGKETIYSFQNLVKIPSFSPKDKKDIEKVEKAKAKEPKPEVVEEPISEETPDKISREDGFRLFEAVKKVYDFIHRMDRTEDPDAAKKDANDKVNQLAKILNPEDVDDFIRYVNAINNQPPLIMSSRDYQKNFSDYLNKYTSGQGVANNPIYRSADGKEIKEGDFLTVVGADGTLKKIQLKIFRRPNPRALSDKTDFIETGYYLEFYKDKDPRIVRIGAPKESYSLDNVFHNQNEDEIIDFINNGRNSVSTPTTPTKPEVVEEAKPAAGADYNKNLENDLAVFRNALEDMVENFRNQPDANLNIYRAAAKELYNELKKLNSLYENSDTSGDDLEQIRNVYDDKIRDLGDVQSAKEKSNPNQNREGAERNITTATQKTNISAVEDAIRNGEIDDPSASSSVSDLFSSMSEFSQSILLKQVAAARLLRYMPDARFDDLLKAAMSGVYSPLFNAYSRMDVHYMNYNGIAKEAFYYRHASPASASIYNAFNADLSDIKENTELLVTNINEVKSLSTISILTVNKELMNSVLEKMGNTDSNSIIKFINDQLFLKVHSSSNQEDVNELKKTMISNLIHTWALSSNDKNIKSHAMQKVAKDIFSMDPKATSEWSFVRGMNQYNVDIYREQGTVPNEVKDLVDLNNHYEDQVDQEVKDHRLIYTQFLHAMYNATQDLLKDQGIDGFIVYRGSDSTELNEIYNNLGSTGVFSGTVQQRPLSSWSTSRYKAESFAMNSPGKNAVVMATIVPADKVISFSGSGFGSMDEREVVVLGGDIKEALFSYHSYPGNKDTSSLEAAIKEEAERKQIVSTDPVSGQTVIQEQSKPSQNRERAEKPINIDSSDENADWIKQNSWDLPTNVDDFLRMFTSRDQLSDFMTKPTAQGMPEDMLRSLWPAADEHFKKIESAPKEEESKYLPEPFDPRDKKIDLDDYYNYDYTKMPDGTPFNSEQQRQMDAVSGKIDQVLKANGGDASSFAVKNLKNFRRTHYQQIIAKPNQNSSTTRDSILEQVEFSDKPAVKYFDESMDKEFTRYVDKFTDKYGRKYYIVTNIDESSGRQTVIAYDEKNFERMSLPEDYVRNDQPVSGSTDVGGLDSYVFRDPSVSEIQSVMVNINYQRRGIATALVAVLEKRLGLPVVHSDNLSSMGFAFSNSMDPGKPDLHTNEKSIELQSDNAPSQNREGFFKRNKAKKEPFDPTDITIDLEKYYNYDYTQMPDGTPFSVYQQQQMDILKDAIDNETDDFERKLRIVERRRIYQGYTAKPNLKSGTNLESIKDQVGLLDDNTSRMNYSGAGKPYADLSPEYKQSTQYIDEFTDKYGRQYWVVTKVVNGLGMSNVKLYDKSKNSLQNLQDNSEDRTPVSTLDVFNNKISMVYTSDRYLRRGLATAALHLARERSGKEVQHSETLTSFGRAFSLSVDPNPDLHRNDESKVTLSNNQPSQNREGQYLPEPFDPNDRTIDLDTIYNYDYTQLPDGTPFNAKQQKIMDWENKNVEDAIASGDQSKIDAAKISRRFEYKKFTTVANPDSKTNMETIADQVTLGKSKPKKFTGFIRYTDKFIDKYGRKYMILTDINTDSSSDKSLMVTVHDLEGRFLAPNFTPEGMENVDQFGGKFLHIASLRVDDDDKKNPNAAAKIGLVLTNDEYRRRGLATAMLYVARKHYKKPVNHSSTLTMYGKAFSNSVDAGKPNVHDSLESKQLQIDLLKQKGLPVEEPELDGDEIDYGPNQNREGAEEPVITNQYLEVIPLNNSYRDKNDPDLDLTQWMTGDTNIYGIGNGGNPLGYVRTEKLATMKGNLADMESSTSSIAHDLEDGTGYLEPVLVWYNPLTGRSFIAEGNHRVAAARIAEREYVPVVVGVSTVDFKNPTTMEKEGGVGDTVLNKDGSLENFKNVKDGSLINPYHLFNDEDLLYPRINLDPNDVPGFTDVLKIQSDLLNNRMSENQETGINDIAKWYDPNAFDVDSSIGYMGGTSEQLKEITAKNIGKNMLSSPKDILGALDHAVSISEVLRSRLSYLDSQKMALKALDTKLDDLNGNSIILFVDDSEHSPYEGLHLETLREVIDFMDPYDEELYGNPYDEKTIDYRTLFEDYYANENKKPIFFDNPDDIEAFKEKAASILVAQWAETSNGSDLVSHALQIAAAEAFNMPAGSWAPWKAQGKDAQTTKDVLENAEYYYGIHSSVLKDFLRTMYDNTQQEFKNRGIKHLLVYRGTGVDQEAVKIDTGIEYNGIGDAEIIQRPMSAWAWLHGDAFNFATSRLQERAGMFMGTIVPIEQVLSIPGTGFGCFEEAEVVLLAGKNRLVRAVTSDSSDPPLNQKAFINQNSGQVISYLLDQLPKDKNAFDNLIEFNSSTPNAAGPSQNREGASINVDDSVENSDWVISEFAKKKKLDAKENELPEGSGQAKPAEEPISLNELHRTFITALLAGAGDKRTRPLSDAKPEWLAADVEADNLTKAEKNAIYKWYMDVAMGDGASSDNLSVNAQGYLTKNIIPLINRHKEDHMLLPHHDIYVNKDNNVTIKVVRFITNPTKNNGKTNVNTEYRAATAAGVAKFANKLSDVLSRVKFKFPVKELQVIITHPNIEDFFKPFTRDDGTYGRNLAGLSFPHLFVNGKILNEEDNKPNPKLTENPRADATELESTIAHEIGHVLEQKGIINFSDQATKDTLRRFMTEYPLSDYAATDEGEYLAEAYAGMMLSEDGIGRYKEVADWINNQIDTVDERKEKAAIDLLKTMLDKLGIPDNSKPSQNREGSREQIIASAAKDIASSGIGFVPGKVKNDISIATDGPVINIEGSPKKDAVAPSDQATAIKNEIIGLGHMILDDARAISDEQARSEGLIPEGFTAEEYRKKLKNDARTAELNILIGESKFKAMSQDLMRNAFNRLSYEDKEEVFQSFKKENAKNSILSGKDKNTFDAEETFNMLLVEYGGDLSHKLAYDYSTSYPEFTFDTGKTVLQRTRNRSGKLTKEVEERKTLVDVTWAHEGPDTILSMLTKWAIQTGKIDISDFAQKAAEIKELRDQLRISPKAEDFVEKYHSIIGKNIKSQMEKAGVEFDSVPAHQFFNQYKDYKYVNSNEKFQDIRIDRNKNLIKNLEETLSFIPKDIIIAGMEYLANTGGKLGVQISDARAQFKQHWKNKNLINSLRWKKEQGDGGFFRGRSTDDYLHEVWHFFQMINHDIAALEHAFSYDRIKASDNTNIIPSMELYGNWVEESFSGAKVADPYTVKVYPRSTSKFATFSPNNHSAEVITTTMQDLFTSPGSFSTPKGVTVKTGKGKNTTLFSDAHMDIATGIWYTDATMTTKIDPKLITGIEGLDPSNDTDWDLKAFGIGLLMSLLNWENK